MGGNFLRRFCGRADAPAASPVCPLPLCGISRLFAASAAVRRYGPKLVIIRISYAIRDPSTRRRARRRRGVWKNARCRAVQSGAEMKRDEKHRGPRRRARWGKCGKCGKKGKTRGPYGRVHRRGKLGREGKRAPAVLPGEFGRPARLFAGERENELSFRGPQARRFGEDGKKRLPPSTRGRREPAAAAQNFGRRKRAGAADQFARDSKAALFAPS